MKIRTKTQTGRGSASDERTTPEGATHPLRLIDDALARYATPRLVSSSEVIDVLLDLRSAVVLDASFAELSEDLDRAWRGPLGMLPLHEPS